MKIEQKQTINNELVVIAKEYPQVTIYKSRDSKRLYLIDKATLDCFAMIRIDNLTSETLQLDSL
jgi:hypothetical protein